MYYIINEAAKVYHGVISADCYHQPYMPAEALEREMESITLFRWEVDEELVGILGLESIKDVTLIRHAYLLSPWRRNGIAGKLLENLKNRVTILCLLFGTWADALWAINFYKKRYFKLLLNKDELLKA